MTYEMLIVAGVVAGSVGLFVSSRFPVDMVSMLVLLSLLLLGVVGTDHILDGFSNSATITVGAMFILSAALERTGVIRWFANKLYYLAGNTAARVNAVLMLTTAGIAGFINNTATVAIMMPLAIRFAREQKVSPSKLLMPLSFVAQFGGVCTLIGTTTNLLVNMVVVHAGLEPMGMFEFTPLGLILMFSGLLFMAFASRYLLPDRTPSSDHLENYRLDDYLIEMVVGKGSSLIGQTGLSNGLTAMGEIDVLDIYRKGKQAWGSRSALIEEGDVLLVHGDMDRVLDVSGRFKLRDWAEVNLMKPLLKARDYTMIEVIVSSDSAMLGRTLKEQDFFWRYHAAVLGVRRRGETLSSRMRDVVLKEGDTLVLRGHKKELYRMVDDGKFAFLQDLSSLVLKTNRAVLSVLILIGVVVAASTGVVPILTAALTGAILVGLTRCLSAQQIYGAIDLQVLFLLAGMIPLGYAMQETGAVAYLVQMALGSQTDISPYVALAAIYLITSLSTELMSNSATALLIAPIAVEVANQLGVDARPFLFAVAYAASSSFATPVGYQTNAMIFGPGGYRYSDFLRVGVPLSVLFFIISMVFIPLFWPF